MTRRDNQQINLTRTCLMSTEILLGASHRDDDCEAKRGAFTHVRNIIDYIDDSSRGAKTRTIEMSRKYKRTNQFFLKL